jgi:hypothetical protein
MARLVISSPSATAGLKAPPPATLAPEQLQNRLRTPRLKSYANAALFEKKLDAIFECALECTFKPVSFMKSNDFK